MEFSMWSGAPKKSNLNSRLAMVRSSVKLVPVNGRMEMSVQLEKDFIEDVVLVSFFFCFRQEQEKITIFSYRQIAEFLFCCWCCH